MLDKRKNRIPSESCQSKLVQIWEKKRRTWPIHGLFSDTSDHCVVLSDYWTLCLDVSDYWTLCLDDRFITNLLLHFSKPGTDLFTFYIQSNYIKNGDKLYDLIS